MSRRDFFSDAREHLKEGIASRLASFGVDLSTPKSARPMSVRKLVESLEPMTAAGIPFGGPVCGFCVIPVSPLRAFVVFGHGASFALNESTALSASIEKLRAQALGLSVIELSRASEGALWEPRFSSPATRRVLASESSVRSGGRIVNGELERFEEAHAGPGAIRALTATPWDTVLFCDDSGWLGEYSPRTSLLTYKFAIGRVFADSIRIEAVAGIPVRVASSGPGGEFVFSSHQKYEARLANLNQSALAIGSIEGTSQECAYAEWVEQRKNLVSDPGTEIVVPSGLRCEFEGGALEVMNDASGAKVHLFS